MHVSRQVHFGNIGTEITLRHTLVPMWCARLHETLSKIMKIPPFEQTILNFS